MNHISIRRRDVATPLAVALLLLVATIGYSARARAGNLDGSATVTTDYVWRGSSQTQGNPAVQAGSSLSGDSGLYASLWGSNVKFPGTGASSEFDLTLGWDGKLARDWALNVYLMRYTYPGSQADPAWNEINAALTWRDNYWLTVGYSTNALASGATGTWTQAGVRVPINDKWRIKGTLGRYFLHNAYANSYTVGSLGVVWAFRAPFEARLTWHDTDAAARRLFSGAAGSRVEFALQASF